MADVDSVVFTTERKVRKVKKTTKRRESHDQNAEVTITEVDSAQNNHNAIEEYVLADNVFLKKTALLHIIPIMGPFFVFFYLAPWVPPTIFVSF